MNLPGAERWTQLWRGTGAQGDPLPWFDQIARHYSEPHRVYHNLTHLAECFREFDSARHLARRPLAVEWAIWFHDVIYDSRAADNEEQSAALARRCLSEAGATNDFTQSIFQLILATKSHDVGNEPDGPLLVDIDLSILGQNESRFWEYEAQIREEYAWVPAPIFSEKRAEILRRFLARQRIYTTDWFREQYEVQARSNLEASVSRLKGM